jgi:hypothetical protein
MKCLNCTCLSSTVLWHDKINPMKWLLKSLWPASSHLRYRPVTCSCEDGIESLVPTKSGEFLRHYSEYIHPRMSPASQSPVLSSLPVVILEVPGTHRIALYFLPNSFWSSSSFSLGWIVSPCPLWSSFFGHCLKVPIPKESFLFSGLSDTYVDLSPSSSSSFRTLSSLVKPQLLQKFISIALSSSPFSFDTVHTFAPYVLTLST